jgi:putative oxidoreductase
MLALPTAGGLHNRRGASDYGVQIGVRFGTDNKEEESNMDFLKNLSPHVHWGLRLSLAATFLFHGASKFPIEGPMMGMPVAMVWLLALAEIAAGVMLIVGAFGKEMLTRLGGLIVIAVMVGAIAMVHAKNGFNVMNGGMEFQLLMLVSGLYLAAKGNDA